MPSVTNPVMTPLTLMRLPPELRHRIYDFVWNEDITIDLLLYAQPLLGGRYNEVRGGIRPQRLIYNSLQLVRKGKGGFRGDVRTVTAPASVQRVLEGGSQPWSVPPGRRVG